MYSESRLMLSLVNVISRLMWSHYKSPSTIAYYIETTGYCYHSVNVITFDLAQSDPLSGFYCTSLTRCCLMEVQLSDVIFDMVFCLKNANKEAFFKSKKVPIILNGCNNKLWSKCQSCTISLSQKRFKLYWMDGFWM